LSAEVFEHLFKLVRPVAGIEQQNEVVTANVADKLFAVIDKAAQTAGQTQQNLITSGVAEVIVALNSQGGCRS
jgi:hypothetical protein